MNDHNPYAAPQTPLQADEQLWPERIPPAAAYRPFAFGAALLCVFIWPLDVLFLKLRWDVAWYVFEGLVFLTYSFLIRVPQWSGARKWYLVAAGLKALQVLAMVTVSKSGIPWAPTRLSQEWHLADEYLVYLGIQLLIMTSLVLGNLRLNRKLDYSPLGDKNESTVICLSIVAILGSVLIAITLWTNSRDKQEGWVFPLLMSTITCGVLCTSLFHAARLPTELERRALELRTDEQE
jgi:hypothetical protein